MPAKDVILQSINVADMVMGMYLGDLPEADFLHRPVGGMNHIAWQVGHLISTERKFLEAIKPGTCPPVPEGFDEKHTKEAAKSDDPAHFHTKAEYMAAWTAQREATKAILATLSDADLEAESPEFIRGFAPTVGAMMNLCGLHPLMHVGQFVAVRRAKNMPIAM